MARLSADKTEDDSKGIAQDILEETDYYFENGMIHVPPNKNSDRVLSKCNVCGFSCTVDLVGHCKFRIQSFFL